MLAEQGIGKILTVTSTYDHRVIQGAGSGEFLKIINELLLGERDFYGQIFSDMRIPYTPVVWANDSQFPANCRKLAHKLPHFSMTSPRLRLF